MLATAIVASAFSFVGCKSLTLEEQRIQLHLAAELNDPELELLEAVEQPPTLASDSFAIVQAAFEFRKDTMLQHLATADSLSLLAYEEAKLCYEKSDFGALQQECIQLMREATSQMLEHERLRKALHADCKGTQLETAYNRMEHYRQLGSAKLNVPFQCRFESNGQNLAATVFMNPDKSKAIGHRLDN